MLRFFGAWLFLNLRVKLMLWWKFGAFVRRVTIFVFFVLNPPHYVKQNVNLAHLEVVIECRGIKLANVVNGIHWGNQQFCKKKKVRQNCYFGWFLFVSRQGCQVGIVVSFLVFPPLGPQFKSLRGHYVDWVFSPYLTAWVSQEYFPGVFPWNLKRKLKSIDVYEVRPSHTAAITKTI